MCYVHISAPEAKQGERKWVSFYTDLVQTQFLPITWLFGVTEKMRSVYYEEQKIRKIPNYFHSSMGRTSTPIPFHDHLGVNIETREMNCVLCSGNINR